MATVYGKNLKISIYGGSHDEHIGVNADGLPCGFEFDLGELQSFMSRRAPGQNLLTTQRKEPDVPEFLEGVTKRGKDRAALNGEHFHAVIRNTSARSADYNGLEFVPRPSHADYAARMKYGEGVDLRGGGHFSGRLTAPMCIVGGICLQYLRTLGIEIGAHLYSVGGVKDTPFDLAKVSFDDFSLLRERSAFPVLDLEAGEDMKAIIDDARTNKDSVGGIVECAVLGLPAGLGEHMFDGVENRISSIVFGIPAVKGIEFGNGFECASLRGSQNNDPFCTDGKRIYTKTNNSGGILGGMSSGMPLVFRAAMKPTPSIYCEQDSVDMVSMKPVKLSIKGRHDPCVVQRALPVFEAAAAIAVVDMLLDEDAPKISQIKE
ncbi:MAG: chorismate synthase [Ruminococcaceae bacterium]|nr:chorismate synthase [Oscillospiraceae bacterium]